MGTMFDSACAFVGKSRDADLDHAKSLGCAAISVYIVGTPGGCSHSTRDDVAAIRSKGLGVVANWERAADFFRGASIAQCQAAGAEAAQAMGDLGFPAGTGCHPSWDYDVLDGDYAAEGLKGAAFAKGLTSRWRLGAYSELGLLRYLIDHRVIPAGVKGWLCMSEGFGHFTDDWGPYVAVVQQHDAAKRWLNPTQPGTDINTIIDAAALGAWWPDGVQPDSSSTTPLSTEDLSIMDAATKTYLDQKFAALGGFIMGDAQKPDLTHPGQLVNIRNAVNALAGKVASSGTDPKAIAAAIVDALPPDLAKEVATEFADLVSKRLAS